MTFFLAVLGGPANQADSAILDLPPRARSEVATVFDSPGDAVRIGLAVAEGGAAPASFAASEDRQAVAVLEGFLDGCEQGAAAILQGYRRSGSGGLARRGDYAFALWDGRERCLWVGCDAVGLRAPAYYWDGEIFAVSSRAVSLLRLVGVRRGWDEAYIANVLSGLWGRAASGTAFRGVQRLVAGELVRARAGRLDRFPGARLDFGQAPRTDPDGILRELEERIDRAVERSMTAGTCLAVSGGLDSTVVACAAARTPHVLDAFSVVAPAAWALDDPGLAALSRVAPRVRHHRVPLPVEPAPLFENGAAVTDDPIGTGPAFQPARIALYDAIRAAGFHGVVDGEGGDEIFDLPWRLDDLLWSRGASALVRALPSRAVRARLRRDLALGGSVAELSGRWLRRAKEAATRERPWVRAESWQSAPFEEAWEDATAFGRLRSPAARLPDILAMLGRHWRAQEVTRASVGIRGRSPLLASAVVELAGAVHPCIAVDPRREKALLRKLAARRVPADVAWRPKDEPMNDRLVQDAVLRTPSVERTVEGVRGSPVLRELLDVAALRGAAKQCHDGAGLWRAPALAELFAVVAWVVAVETRFGL